MIYAIACTASAAIAAWFAMERGSILAFGIAIMFACATLCIGLSMAITPICSDQSISHAAWVKACG